MYVVTSMIGMFQYSKKGFTIVELLVGVGIFILLLGGGIGSLDYSIQLQRMVLSHQGVATEISYAVEYMSRALRMAIQDGSGDCLNGANESYNVNVARDEITFVNHLQSDTCQKFYLESGRIMYLGEDGLIYPMTSPHITISNLRFEISGHEGDDGAQPRATVVLRVTGDSLREPMDLQKTVSMRSLDVEIN